MGILYLTAAFLGLVEGLTEFLPISSTGHLILLVDLLDFQAPPGKTFEIVIQLGAILAVCWAYRQRLTAIAVDVRARAAAIPRAAETPVLSKLADGLDARVKHVGAG